MSSRRAKSESAALKAGDVIREAGVPREVLLRWTKQKYVKATLGRSGKKSVYLYPPEEIEKVRRMWALVEQGYAPRPAAKLAEELARAARTPPTRPLTPPPLPTPGMRGVSPSEPLMTSSLIGMNDAQLDVVRVLSSTVLEIVHESARQGQTYEQLIDRLVELFIKKAGQAHPDFSSMTAERLRDEVLAATKLDPATIARAVTFFVEQTLALTTKIHQRILQDRRSESLRGGN